MKRYLPLLVLPLALLACRKPAPSTQTQPAPPLTAPGVSAPPPAENARLSFAFAVEKPSGALSLILYPRRPLYTSVEVMKEGLRLSYPDDQNIDVPFDAAVPLSEPLYRFDLNRKPEAARAKAVYRVEGASIVAEGIDPLPAPYTPSAFPVSGPVLLENALIVATAAPSILFLNPQTLQPFAECPIAHKISGPLALVEGKGLLLAVHADGSLGLYDLTSGISSVEDLLYPSSAALGLIRTKTAELFGKGDVTIEPAEVALGRNPLSGGGPWLFRLEGERDSRFLLSLEDGQKKTLAAPYLIALFAVDGSFIESNLDYSAERYLTLHAKAGVPVFAVAGLLEGSVPASAVFAVEEKK